METRSNEPPGAVVLPHPSMGSRNYFGDFFHDVVAVWVYDENENGAWDEGVWQFEIRNTSDTACYQDVVFQQCGELARHIADLGCPSTEPECPDMEACGYLDFYALYEECSTRWGWCTNAGLGLDPYQSVTVSGLPAELGGFDPNEAKLFDVSFTGNADLVHFIMGVDMSFQRDGDCDGSVDGLDNCPDTYNADQTDADGDGFGAACECDDLDEHSHPGALEICGDEKDNNCNGDVDEDCIFSGQAFDPPEIDGFIDDAEWATASVVDITNAGVEHPVTLRVMNDNDYLYMAVEDLNDDTHYGEWGIYFDDEPSGIPDASWSYDACPSDEGNFWISNYSGPASNIFRGIKESDPYFCDAVEPAPYVTSRIVLVSGHHAYEAAIDLHASPLRASPGSMIGVYFHVYDYEQEFRNGLWPIDGYFIDPSTYGTLALATGPFCRDMDGDGYGSPAGADCTYPEEDCDDSDPDVHPGALETCDGKDNDCNGIIDEGFEDADGDGYAYCVDCDEERPEVNPGSSEDCKTDYDDDCDGDINEDCCFIELLGL